MNVRGWGDRWASPFATPVFQWPLGPICSHNRAVVGDDHRQVLGLGYLLSEQRLGGSQRPSAEVRDFASLSGVEPLAELNRDLDRPSTNAPLLKPFARVGAHHERWLACPSPSFARGHKSDIAALFRPSCCEHVLPCRDASGAQRKSGYAPTPYGHRSPDLRAGCEGRRPHPTIETGQMAGGQKPEGGGRGQTPGPAYQDVHRIPDLPAYSPTFPMRDELNTHVYGQLAE